MALVFINAMGLGLMVGLLFGAWLAKNTLEYRLGEKIMNNWAVSRDEAARRIDEEEYES